MLVAISLAIGLAGAFAATRMLSTLALRNRRMGSADLRRDRGPDLCRRVPRGMAAGAPRFKGEPDYRVARRMTAL